MNQKGIAQIVVVLIILAGLALGVYLIGQKTFFKPKASLEGTRIEFAGTSVSGDKTTSRNVKLRAYYIPPTVSAPVGGTYQTPPYGSPPYQTPTSVSAPTTIYQTPSARVQGVTAGSYAAPPVGGVYPTYFNVSNDAKRLHYDSTDFIFKGNPTEVDWTLTPGNGTKTVYAEFKLNGVWGNRVQASITLAEPTVSGPVTPAPSPSPASTSKTVTYNLYPGDNFIGLPFKSSSTYPVDKFLQDTGGKCNTVWTTETSVHKMYVYPKGGQITDYFSNESVLDISKLDLQVLVGGRGYFVKCSSSAEVQLTGAPADLSDWESSIRQWVGVPTNQKYISYLAAPYNNQNLGSQRVKTLDLLNKATQGTRNCTEVLTPRVICTTSGEACSISGTTSYKKNGFGNFTLRDDTGYAVKCVTELAPSPSPSPSPTLRPTPIPTPTLRPSPTPTLRPSPTPTPQPVACSACSADINKDGVVNMQDFSRLSSCFNRRSTDTIGGFSCSNADLNGDRVVTILDYSCLASKFNQRCSQNITTQPRVSTQVVSNNPPTITSSVYRGFFTRIVITSQDVDRDNINVTVSGKPANSYGPYCFGSNGSRTCYIYTRSVSGTITATASDGKGGTATTIINVR